MSDEYETLGEAIEYLQGLVTDGCNGRVVLDIGHDPTLCPIHDPFPFTGAEQIPAMNRPMGDTAGQLAESAALDARAEAMAREGEE